MTDEDRVEAGRDLRAAASPPQGAGACEVAFKTPLREGDLGLVVLDQQLRIWGFTAAAGESLRLRTNDVGGPVEYLARHLDDSTFEADVRAVLAGGVGLQRNLRTTDGRSLSAALLPLSSESAPTAGVVVLATGADSQRHEPERTEHAWRDLDEFVSIAAHDLREPLRTIRGFCQVLERRSGGRLDDEDRTCLARIGAAAMRMQSLVDGMLRAAGISAMPFESTPTDMNALVEGVVADLHETVAACGATVTWGALPTVSGSAPLLRQLVLCLLENALEYRGDGSPSVVISAERSGPDWQFAVRDNGIGIPREHHARIFEVFRRLDPARSPGRSGVGLTIAKRVVERHGGRLWVDSVPNRGSTFYFTLPAAGRHEG